MAESSGDDSEDGVAAALARLEVRARKRMRTRLPIALVAGGAVAYFANRWGLDDHTRPRHHAGSIVRGLIVVGVLLVLLALVVLVLWKTRKRWAAFSLWKQPLPAAGLNWRERRIVYRDIRRATPSRDPVLRAVEIRSVERLRKIQPRWTLWVWPAVAVVTVITALLPGRTESGRVFYFIFAAMFVLSGLAALRLRRGVDRFPGTIA